MKHDCYYEISASSSTDLGLQRGELFGDVARVKLADVKYTHSWLKKLELSKDSFDLTKKYFPHYIEELEGYAKASGISMPDFWTLSVEDDLDYVDKCTTVVTNNGKLTSHNEDWDVDASDLICVLRKTLNEVTTFEFFYYNTLGGASSCVNSFGIAMMINTLSHTDRQTGVPRNIIARWLSETKDPKTDFDNMKSIPRSLGYNHVFASTSGSIWNIESSATKEVLTMAESPFVHTNHYLEKEMLEFEENDGSTGTYERYDQAKALVKPQMSVEEIISLNSNSDNGTKDSIMNERTIGKMVFDLEQRKAYVWLRREIDKGFVEYPLDFIQN